MIYIDRNGKSVNVNNCSGKSQDRMIKNGWIIKLTDNCNESPQELYDRLNAMGMYKDIKIYWAGTQVKGIRKYFAMVK